MGKHAGEGTGNPNQGNGRHALQGPFIRPPQRTVRQILSWLKIKRDGK